MVVQIRKSFSKEKALEVIDEVIREIMYIEKKKKNPQWHLYNNTEVIKTKEEFARRLRRSYQMTSMRDEC